MLGSGGVGHDVIKIFNLRVIQCNFDSNLKMINLIKNRLQKICRFQIHWGTKLIPGIVQRYLSFSVELL